MRRTFPGDFAMSNHVSCALNADDSWLDPEDSDYQMSVMKGVIVFILFALILLISGAPYSDPVVFLFIVAEVFCADLAFHIGIRELYKHFKGK